MFWWAQRGAADPRLPTPPPPSGNGRRRRSLRLSSRTSRSSSRTILTGWKLLCGSNRHAELDLRVQKLRATGLKKWPVLSFVFVFNNLPKLIIWLLPKGGKTTGCPPFLLAWKNQHTLRIFFHLFQQLKRVQAALTRIIAKTQWFLVFRKQKYLCGSETSRKEEAKYHRLLTCREIQSQPRFHNCSSKHVRTSQSPSDSAPTTSLSSKLSNIAHALGVHAEQSYSDHDEKHENLIECIWQEGRKWEWDPVSTPHNCCGD